MHDQARTYGSVANGDPNSGLTALIIVAAIAITRDFLSKAHCRLASSGHVDTCGGNTRVGHHTSKTVGTSITLHLGCDELSILIAWTFLERRNTGTACYPNSLISCCA